VPNYLWSEFTSFLLDDQQLAFRFPEWAIGYRQLGELRHRAETADLAILLADLIKVRQDLDSVNARKSLVPRVFISHRQADSAEAVRISKIAAHEGFEFWLDVLDPHLNHLNQGTMTDEQRAYFIAICVEIALLNCTHVLALITSNTEGSMWVPYEYGRAKAPSIWSTQAACWIAPNHKNPLSEYLHLGVKTRNDTEMTHWFRSQRNMVVTTP
jgi:hypothetical protein